MGIALHQRVDIWKKLLLDFGKRNRLINFIETKRSNVKITAPSIEELYDIIAIHEKHLCFLFAKKVKVDENGEESYDIVVPGDIETTKPLGELQKTLKALRYKANTSIEEQGINTLYLAFGLLKWTESDNSKQILSSPLVLVPARLTIESLTSPYKLSAHEDEIVVNPTLAYKLQNDFGITLPDFDSDKDDIEAYLNELERLVDNKGWTISRDVNLTILSFLKINMFKDLERNEEKLNASNVISAIAGESEPISISSELNNYDHDNKTKPIDTFQVVDADSSQQDAVLLSKNGASFVLQGPPGTGKSQTITNIISEALADGKKVLFVSEKMAALQVVYKRLTGVGLSDFCFTLHSHKANKKEILRDLATSLTIDRKKVREEALTQLETLQRKKESLNEYQNQLHANCSGLNCSIYNINGKLAKLDHVPEIIFEIVNVDKMTQSELNDRIYLLSEFSKTVGKQSEDYKQNVWRNSTVDFLSNELRHDIDSYMSSLLPQLEDINSYFEDCCKELGLVIKPSLEGLDLIIQLLSLVGDSPTIPIKWLYKSDIDDLIYKAEQHKDCTHKIVELDNYIRERYNDSVFSLDGEQYRIQLSLLKNDIVDIVKFVDNSIVIDHLDKYIEKIDNELCILSGLFDKGKEIATLIGITEPKNLSDIKYVVALSRSLSVKIMPTELWFNEDNLLQIKNEIAKIKALHNEVVNLRNSILTNFDKEIFEIDSYSMLKRFRGEYDTIFRRFKSNYKVDISTLKQYSSNGTKLKFNEVFTLLNDIKSVADKRKEIESNKNTYQAYFGSYYNGLETDWNKIEEDIDKFQNIITQLQSRYIPEKLKHLLFSQTLSQGMLSELNCLYDIHPSEIILNNINSLISAVYDEQTQYSDIKKTFTLILTNVKNLIERYNEVIATRKEKVSFEEVIKDLEQLAKMQTLLKELEEQKQEISERYENYYSGTKTDWDKTIEALVFTKEFKVFIEKTHLPEEFIEKVCSDSKVVSYCKTSAIHLTKEREKMQSCMRWILALFNESEQLQRYYLKDLYDRLMKCKNKMYLLEEWVDYRSNRHKCEEVGLATYIEQVEDKSIDSNYIVDAYLKRFYRLWLDSILPLFPAVQSFRGRVQEQTIREFQELDRLQFKIAQSRVRERVCNRIPDFDSITSTRDEINILKRELNKQRRLMPLRKLFMAIPNLLTAIRPCFMMSPLSVSVFLEAKSYDFDLVIFDEASQVHTEDAIGAIMRGKQTIIVGDTKQLPPTSFFASSLEDEDFDNDEEVADNYAGAYQSILDESVAVLPERSLRWHYRSRDEHLIAFSNIKIYNNSLITFPSSVERVPDVGVEYVYVPNGVYDRGSKRNNVIEAKTVAELVFNHFRKYPNRSLGVVTFSEAQQQAVDAAIRQIRLQNGMFERYFNEDRDEPFFIKNLENVQGDERDTIIFSIGYAKDNNGIMYMNFGPLSKDGGYRRLNVAITRAKYNIKLVGSIMPTDIDIEKTSSEGVRLLRSYMAFAQQGIVALQKELSYVDSLEFDSPFEEAVYAFLSDKGYEVITQVGCSGFRIDMAIKHPKHSGQFAIGIECDGATYHSSRTARERDRLRQAVLEDMGWTIYRIWSTDWIKDPRTEEQKLVNAIDRALSKTVDESYLDDADIDNIDTSDSLIEIEEKVDIRELSSNNECNFAPYVLANISDFEHLDDFEVIRKVIEIEQPIHFEELCRRVAPLYGNYKVTSKVRCGVEQQFKWHLAESITRNGDFITLNDFSNLQVRTPDANSDFVRPINFISEDELGLAMMIIAQKSFGITSEDLFVATARYFGFKRMGENIVSTLHNAYNKLLNTDKIKEIDGKVNVL